MRKRLFFYAHIHGYTRNVSAYATVFRTQIGARLKFLIFVETLLRMLFDFFVGTVLRINNSRFHGLIDMRGIL